MAESMATKVTKLREETGTVVSVGGDKSCAVRVDRLVRHRLYDKYMRRKTKLAVHDPANEAGLGDIVAVSPCRPVSKRKRWRLVRVVKKATLVQQRR